MGGTSTSACGTRRRRGKARYARSYHAAPCQTVLTTVDSTGIVGFQSSLAVGVDGNPVISHYDNTNGDLKVARLGR